MRCDICKYSKNDSCSLSLLIKEEEQYENEEGIGCKYNQRTLDNRLKKLTKLAGNPNFW